MKTEVFIAVDEPTPIAFLNLYEDGDRWNKIKGCEGCLSIKKCCGTCPMLTSKGCTYHLEQRRHSNKPLNCVINPVPTIAKSYCQLEYECIQGNNKGKIRKVSDPNGVIK